MLEYQHHIKNNTPIMPIITHGYEFDNYSKWWPEEMKELENHALFFDWRKVPEVENWKHYMTSLINHCVADCDSFGLPLSFSQHHAGLRMLLSQIDAALSGLHKNLREVEQLKSFVKTQTSMENAAEAFARDFQDLESIFPGLIAAFKEVQGAPVDVSELFAEFGVSGEDQQKQFLHTVERFAAAQLTLILEEIKIRQRLLQSRISKQLVSQINTHLEEWRGTVPAQLQASKQIVPCPICTSEGLDVSGEQQFNRDECEELFADWKRKENSRRAEEAELAGGDVHTAVAEDSLPQPTMKCGHGHELPVGEVLSHSVIYEAIPCPRCVLAKQVPPYCFLRQKCLLYFSEENVQRKGALDCQFCAAAGRLSSIRILDIITPEVFISYQWGLRDANQKDRLFTQQFVNDLRIRIEQTADVICWIDIAGGLTVGSNLMSEMMQGIRNCTVVLLFLSDSYVNSDNCKREYLSAVRFSKFVIPVLAPDLGKITIRTATGDSRKVCTGWSGKDGREKDWWKHILNVCEESKDPDSGETIDWSWLSRFEPIDMRSEVQKEPGSPAEIQIVRRICSRFHRQGYINHVPTHQYSAWKENKEVLKIFDCLKDVDVDSESGEQQLRRFFDGMDEDGNGSISATELRKRLERFGMTVTEDFATQLVRDADSNHDAQLDFLEFKSLLRNFRETHLLE